MTCYRSRDNWHSYVKNDLSVVELDEMASHLAHCSECRNVVTLIRTSVDCLAKNRMLLSPPAEIKINVMKAIDKNKYRVNLSNPNSFHLIELRNWGFSMIAAGILLFALNISTLNPHFEAGQMTQLPSTLSKQMAIPFDKMSEVANEALGKIESLTLSKPK